MRRISGASWRLFVLGILLAMSGAAVAQTPKPLLAGSLTWEVNPSFTTGNRTVTFTLQTAFELDSACDFKTVRCVGGGTRDGDPCSDAASTQACTSNGGKCAPAIYCADKSDVRYGVLCVDQFQHDGSMLQNAPGVSPVLSAVQEYTGVCPYGTDQRAGTRNSFEVVNVKLINGVRVVYGRKIHTVQVAPGASALIAYFATNLVNVPAGQTAGVMGPRQGVLMGQCNFQNVQTPCSVNTFDSRATPYFGLMKDSSGDPINPANNGAKYGSVKNSIYWRKEFSAWANKGASLGKQSPSLETLVQLCSDAGAASIWNCKNGTDRVTNYFSPVSAFPAFAEFPVTPLTQNATNVANKTGGYFWFNNGTGFFKAPHQPFYIKSYDYDGHMMSQFDYNSAVFPQSSNRRAECFDGRMDGKYTSAQGSWPFMGTWANPDGTILPEQKCKMYFGEVGTDSSPSVAAGNLFKLDFDFGTSNVSSPRASDVYNNVWLRCADGKACSPRNTPPCADGSTCSGSRMFSQHVINTVDFPFVDVDNEKIINMFDLRVPQWFSTETNAKSALSQSVFSAYGCWSGTNNQPPRFVKSLDAELNWESECGLVPSADDDFIIETEIRCKVNETCIFPLHARDFTMNSKGESDVDTTSCINLLDCAAPDPLPPGPADARFQSCDPVQIYMLPGWDNIEPRLVHAHCSKDRSMLCVRDKDCSDMGLGTCTGSEGQGSAVCESGNAYNESGAAKCFYKEKFTFEDAGKYVVRCFSTRDVHGDLDKQSYPAGTDPRLTLNDLTCDPLKIGKSCEPLSAGPTNDEKRTCSSAPLCFRIRVESSAPYFVSPTPLEENSYDDTGKLVKGRTDVGACEGYPMQFTLSARDQDEGDMVRIFLEDKDVDGTVLSAAKKLLIDLPAGEPKTNNLDFFDNTSLTVDELPLACAGTQKYDEGQRSTKEKWFGFTPYDAKKTGDNSLQPTVVALEGEPNARSIMSPYLPTVQYAKEPRLSVQYTLDPRKRNGITVRNSDTETLSSKPRSCYFGDDTTTVDDNRCRQKMMNMDQVVCAYAYDNSRAVRRRWVGKRNPNTDLSKNRRDHSNGDMASPMHCWRIRMQAPPVFVTDPLLQASPFNPNWQVAAEDGRLLTAGGDESAYPTIQVQIGKKVSRTFIAWDPNPEDSIEIFIVGDPPPPSGLVVGRTTCIPQEGMCGATDLSGSATQAQNLYFGNQKASSCSKAKLTVTWTPGPEHQGLNAKVCAVARDSSTLCNGKGPKDATSSGWYGEQMCMIFQVGKPTIEWSRNSDVLPTGTSSQFGYVGCQVKITAAAEDQAKVYDVDVDVAGGLPNGAVVTTAKQTGQAQKIVTWIPKRGTEGSTVTICFVARDEAGALPPLAKACRTITVQKCQYCVRGGDTLATIMKGYGLDTNWLRIWLHNGNANPAGSGLPIMVDNPDLIVPKSLQDLSEDEKRSNAQGLPVIYVGPIYAVQAGESLPLLARKFRTTVSSILSVNPDIRGEEHVVPGLEMCLIPCAGQELKA